MVRAFGDSDGKFQAYPLCCLLDYVKNAAMARTLVQPVLEAILAGPPGLWLDTLRVVYRVVRQTPQTLREDLPRLARYIPRIMRYGWETQAGLGVLEDGVLSALALARTAPDEAQQWLEWLLTMLAERDAATENPTDRGLPLALAVPLAVLLAAGDFACFQAIVQVALARNYEYEWQRLEEGVTGLARVPELRPLLAVLFPQQPQRCINLLARIGLTRRLDPANLAPLAALDPATGAESAPPPDWEPLLRLAPALAAPATAYCHARRLLGQPPDLPVGVRRALDQPDRWAAELAYLTGRCAADPARADLAARAANLRTRLADRERVEAGVREEAAERLEQLTVEAQLAAAEGQVRACYCARLAQVMGPLPADLILDDDWLNATLLMGDIQHNRRLLRRLLRARLAGDPTWPERHPANQAFLAGLAARGVDRAAWLDTAPHLYRCAGVAGGHVRLHLERDPLRILQMGNYFDTCLSFGGANAFSTVANACELNKRVVYATDGAGRVVGRKLIGLTAEGALVGFRTYSALRDKAGNDALRAIFRRYLTAFAARCGLPLAGEGTVPRLFAPAWYDDGAVPWHDEDRRSPPHPADPRPVPTPPPPPPEQTGSWRDRGSSGSAGPGPISAKWRRYPGGAGGAPGRWARGSPGQAARCRAGDRKGPR